MPLARPRRLLPPKWTRPPSICSSRRSPQPRTSPPNTSRPCTSRASRSTPRITQRGIRRLMTTGRTPSRDSISVASVAARRVRVAASLVSSLLLTALSCRSCSFWFSCSSGCRGTSPLVSSRPSRRAAWSRSSSCPSSNPSPRRASRWRQSSTGLSAG